MTAKKNQTNDPTPDDVARAVGELDRRRGNGETIVDDVDFITREMEHNRGKKGR